MIASVSSRTVLAVFTRQVVILLRHSLRDLISSGEGSFQLRIASLFVMLLRTMRGLGL